MESPHRLSFHLQPMYFFVSLIHVNQLSISFGTTSKPEEHGGGRLINLHEFRGVRTCNYNSFHWKQALFGERIGNNFVKSIKIWHLLRNVMPWTVGSSVMLGCTPNNKCTSPRVNTIFGMTSLCMPKVTWTRVNTFAKISAYRAEALLKGIDQSWGPRNVLCRSGCIFLGS